MASPKALLIETEVGTNNGKTERQPAQTINNQSATTGIHQQPPTATLDNPPSIKVSTTDTQQPTTKNYYRQIKPRKTLTSDTQQPTSLTQKSFFLVGGGGAGHPTILLRTEVVKIFVTNSAR